MAIFKGAGVAIVTPMYDNEEINYDKLEELINMQIDNGTDAIIIAGTTGESPCLSMEEHAKVIKAAVEFTKHRVPVVAGTGSNCPNRAMQPQFTAPIITTIKAIRSSIFTPPHLFTKDC